MKYAVAYRTRTWHVASVSLILMFVENGKFDSICAINSKNTCTPKKFLGTPMILPFITALYYKLADWYSMYPSVWAATETTELHRELIDILELLNELADELVSAFVELSSS